MKRVAIIGSGLAAVSAAKVLISRGLKPTIIDSGDLIDGDRASVIKRMSQLTPEEWSEEDLDLVTSNPTIHDKNKFPQKLAFGSNYFYGKDNQYQPVVSDGISPPISYAKGGFSIGWGASVLAPDDNDIKSWPISNNELAPYFKLVLSDLPYSAADDDISSAFPLYSNGDISSLELTHGNREILKSLKNSCNIKSNQKILVGKSRLLVRVSENSKFKTDGCKYCGYCTSGCVYGYIYKATQDIDEFVNKELIEYFPHTLVQSLSEDMDGVSLFVHEKNSDEIEEMRFDKVLVAAGAVNSTRIVMQSKKIYDQAIRLLSTVTFIAPVFSFKKIKIDWPSANTQPEIFLEYKMDNQSEYWVHTQVSTPNEMVFNKLGININRKNIIQWIKKRIIEHIFIVHGNIHSDYSNGYLLTLKKNKKNETILYSNREYINKVEHILKQSVWQLFKILRRVGYFILIPFVQNSIKSGGFHVGGTMPMKETPEKEMDTNIMGNPKGWKHIHVIDSSIFPSLPGTTIGLLAMANSARIASELDID